MKVLVVGNGGREHALMWKLLQSEKVTKVFCVPGNGGTATMPNCQNLAMSVDDFDGIARFALVQGVAFVVVGPELPLALGITDALQAQDIPVFGPTKAGAQIESSKAWAKALMQEAGIPTAQAATFDRSQRDEAKAYAAEVGAPIVVKADGLAAGKGVVVAQTIEEAQTAIDAIAQGQFGEAGQTIVVEEFLKGQEVSVLALTDGQTIVPLLPAQDHKPIGEGDTGLNTGGMGAYAPTPVLSAEQMQRVQREILEPTLATLRQRGIDYRGVLYAGLMVTPEGEPKVLEFNCRFGDPETQAVLPLLETPLEMLMLACIEGRLAQMPPIEWKSGAAVCVVMASGGYPGTYEKGKLISGINEAEEAEAVVFHAGTQLKQQQIVTSGGRVLGVTAVGETFEDAIAKSYAAVERITFEECYYRRDIGYRIR
ncbi:MAG: phosphoribosylamine--glycine ligase [Cyanobacteria bacterium SID2]|nr:phosphoribosylamine--glycine ligase [Cyanobacteria bacterium SID2]MBP0006788.1 phosphoribosylamine--glycine ligase [Cyanobacteria bacterium SBC]